MSRPTRFDENFFWGSATSSHQVEGDNRNNDWWRWEQAGKTKDPSGSACDQYNLYAKDIELAASLGHNAYRFSLEWSRIEPERGVFDRGAIDHYKDIIAKLREANIEPIVTVNHFTLPLWLSKNGGWAGEESVRAFRRFTEIVADALGRDIRYWITINEPTGYAYTSYIEGSWPPGERSFKRASFILVKLLKAHCVSYAAIHDTYRKNGWPRPMVSISKHLLVFHPCRRGSRGDRFAAHMRDYYFNRLFIESLLRGWCAAPGVPLARLPHKGSLDFLGINYYTRDFVHYKGLCPAKIFGNICTHEHHEDEGERNFLRWEIYPRGMYEVLKSAARYGLPIFITENGMCTDDDTRRVPFIKDHLKEMTRAMEDGVKVIGYLHWSLVDNFEWAHGYGPRFGMIGLDRATQRRNIKKSAIIFSELIKNPSLIMEG